MRIALFKGSRESFIQALGEAGVAYEELRVPPGQVMASGTMIAVAQTAAVAGPIAAVLVACCLAQSTRQPQGHPHTS